MDSVERGAGLESRHVVGSDLAQFTVGGDHSSFAPAADLAFLLHRGKRSLLRVIRMLWKHNQSRIERQGRSRNVSHSCFGEGAILRDENMYTRQADGVDRVDDHIPEATRGTVGLEGRRSNPSSHAKCAKLSLLL